MTILLPFQRHWLSFLQTWLKMTKDMKISLLQMTYQTIPNWTTSKGWPLINSSYRITNGKWKNLHRNSLTSLSVVFTLHLVQNSCKMSTKIKVKAILTVLMISGSIKYSKSLNTLTIRTTTTNRSRSSPKNTLRLRIRKT